MVHRSFSRFVEGVNSGTNGGANSGTNSGANTNSGTISGIISVTNSGNSGEGGTNAAPRPVESAYCGGG